MSRTADAGPPEDDYAGVPSPDPFMSRPDLTAAAELLRESIDWSRLPKLAAIFQHRPSVNVYWHELVALTLASLEAQGQVLNIRAEAKSLAGTLGGVSPMPKLKGWIGVDLDGTLAHYTKETRGDGIGAPIPEMVERVKRWIAAGNDVRIFTARIDVPREDLETTIDDIEQWCLEHLGEVLLITCIKDQDMDELWDDRAVSVEPNTGRPLSPSRRGLR